MGVFGQTKKDPKERVRELKKKMRHESNGIRRQMNRMQMEEEKVRFFCKFEFQQLPILGQTTDKGCRQERWQGRLHYISQKSSSISKGSFKYFVKFLIRLL